MWPESYSKFVNIKVGDKIRRGANGRWGQPRKVIRVEHHGTNWEGAPYATIETELDFGASISTCNNAKDIGRFISLCE